MAYIEKNNKALCNVAFVSVYTVRVGGLSAFDAYLMGTVRGPVVPSISSTRQEGTSVMCRVDNLIQISPSNPLGELYGDIIVTLGPPCPEMFQL